MTFRRRAFKTTLFGFFSVLLLLLPQMATYANAQGIDLTGLWKDDTGGGAIYRLRQVGNRVYWIVDGSPMGSFVNLSYGEISGNTISGIWVDLPNSPSLGGGNIALRIESNDRLVKVSETAHYGAQAWTRVGSTGGVVIPPPPASSSGRGRYLTVRLMGPGAVVEWSNAPTTNGSWVSIVPLGTPDDRHVSWWVFTKNQPSGSYEYGPLARGSYEARFYADEGYGQLVDRVRFELGAETAPDILRVQVDGRGYAIVTWSNAPTPERAWVSVVPVGTSDAIQVGMWAYTNRSTAGQYEAGPLSAGEYEARFYGNAGYDWLIQRVRFRVP
jgi:hypothetical protein